MGCFVVKLLLPEIELGLGLFEGLGLLLKLLKA
jgi:hypothetical protein